MNDAFVLLSDQNSSLLALNENYEQLTPEMRKAARFVMENPQEVGVSTVREIADAAQVNPNTFIRMARQLGFDGYEGFRAPFREAIREGFIGFPDRARWLQQMRKSGDMGRLYADMVSSAIQNIEMSFAHINEQDLCKAAELIWQARNVFTLGVGVNHSIARNFTYLASTGMVQFHAIPRAGSVAFDDLAFSNDQDVLLAITTAPYRNEVIEATNLAKDQGVKIIGISDSPASPLIMGSDIGFIVYGQTPQFFPSSVATIALLETLLSFVIASASDNIIERVEQFHNRRHALGLYHESGI